MAVRHDKEHSEADVKAGTGRASRQDSRWELRHCASSQPCSCEYNL